MRAVLIKGTWSGINGRFMESWVAGVSEEDAKAEIVSHGSTYQRDYHFIYIGSVNVSDVGFTGREELERELGLPSSSIDFRFTPKMDNLWRENKIKGR